MSTASPVEVETMRAILREEFGTPDRMQQVEAPVPQVGDDQVLVEVRASSVNAMEWHLMTGEPYLVRASMGLFAPKEKVRVLGADIAGVVTGVGDAVTQFQPGDEVFGDIGAGGYADYVVAPERGLVPKPSNVSFEHAAAAPVAGLTALQGLRDHGKLEAGQKVLIIGASGGVGTFAVQIAKAMGAEVTAVCSTRNVEQSLQIGADHVVDYKQEDLAAIDESFDLILDISGARPVKQLKALLNPNGTYVMIGGPKGKWLGPIPHLLRAKWAFRGGDQTMAWFVASMNQEDLAYLGELLASGSMRSVVEKEYPLQQVPEALAYLGEGHARGKIVIKV